MEAKEEKKEAKFRLSNQYVMLTYKTWLDKIDVKKHFAEKFGFKQFEIAHETGKEGGYEHTHIVINFGYTFRSTNQRIFDINEIHPNIVTFKPHELKIKLNYLAKEDPENAHLKSEQVKTLSSKVWECKDKTEVLMMAQKPSEAQGLLTIFENKPKEIKKDDLKLNIWQQELFNELQQKPDDRHVYWIYDQNGGIGKSRFAKYLTRNKLAYNITSFGGTYHTSQVIRSAFEEGWNGQILTVDLSRDFQDKEIYAPLEAIKNGSITSSKYKGSTLDFDSPHVVIFANFLPDVIRFSLDRWKIWDIRHDKHADTYNIKKVSAYDLLKKPDLEKEEHKE